MRSGILRTYVKTLRLRLDQTLDEVARTKKMPALEDRHCRIVQAHYQETRLNSIAHTEPS